MTTGFQQLRRIRDELRKELEASELFVAWFEADAAVRRIEARFGVASSAAAEACVGTDEAIPTQHTTDRDALEEAVAVIMETMRPFGTSQLIAAIEARGVSLVGKDPIKVFRSRLSKDSRIRSYQIGPSRKLHRVWWLIDRPLPQGMTEYSPPPIPVLGADVATSGGVQKDTAPPNGEAVMNPGAGLAHQ